MHADEALRREVPQRGALGSDFPEPEPFALDEAARVIGPGKTLAKQICN
jgi:hypothetical protein